MKQNALKCSLKIQRDVSRTIATFEMELFMALVSGFQVFTNFTKNSILVVTGVLDLPLEHYKVL